MKALHLKDTGSTNSYARKLIDSGAAEQMVISADIQKAGRGQYERSFASPEGGLYFSILCRPVIAQELIPLITLAVGVGCGQCIGQLFDLSPTLKWPNDIYLDDKKLGGILCESVISPGKEAWVIIGVGLNVNTSLSAFPPELQPSLTTLYHLTGKETDIDQLRCALVGSILKKISALADNVDLVLETWRNYDYLLGRSVRYADERKVLLGVGRGLAGDGCYLIEVDDGSIHRVLGGTLRHA